ncbi:MAG: TolC family protein [Desulfobacterium sp.]|nr:TolC family protein [Desulfobacterium sp.]
MNPLFLFVALTMVLSGCVVHEPVQLPRLVVPQTWSDETVKARLTVTAGLLDLVDDPRARALVQEGLNQNHDLRAAGQRLAASGLLLSGPLARRFPTVSAGMDLARNNQGENHDVGSQFKFSGTVRWEVDIWGRLKDLYDAEEAGFRASEADYRAAMDSLGARVITLWIQGASARQRMALEEKRIEIHQKSEATVLERYQQGLGNLNDLASVRSTVEQARAELVQEQCGYAEIARSLEILVGRYPDASLDFPAELPQVDHPPVRVPGAVLENRPDIKALMARLEAAHLVTVAEKKAMLPGVTLSADLFKSPAQLGGLGSASTLWGTSVSILQPVFNNRSLRAKYEAMKETEKALVDEYCQAVLRAMKEVENAFGREKAFGMQAAHLARALEQAEQNSRYYFQRYTTGLASILDLNQVNDQALLVRKRLVAIRKARLINRIDMAKALAYSL